MATSTKASKNIYRLFVGNLPWTVSHLELKQYFSDFGRVLSANVVFDKKKRSNKGLWIRDIQQFKDIGKDRKRAKTHTRGQ